MPVEAIVRAVAFLGEGVSPRKVRPAYGVDKDTMLRWLVEAAAHSGTILGYMLHDLPLSDMRGKAGE